MYSDLFDDPKLNRTFYEEVLRKRGVKTKQTGRGGTLSSLISEGGALGGAAAGAAVGSVVPIVGTAIGGVLGAGLGAFGGRIAENKYRDDRLGIGDAAKEGALSAVLAGPLKLGKYGMNAAKASKAGLGLAESLKAGAEGAAKAGLKAGASSTARTGLERSSERLLGNAWGVRPGVKLNGKVITPQRAAELQTFVKSGLKIPKAANADQVLEYAASFQDEVGKGISAAVRAGGPIDTKPLTQNLQSKFSNVIGSDGANNPVAKDILKRVREAKGNPEALWNVRRNIDDTLISFGRNPNTAVPGAEQIARAARTEINKSLRAVPGYKDLSKQYGNASTVIELSGAAAKTPKGMRLPGFLGSIAGPEVQQARSVAGRVVGKAGAAQRSLVNALATPTGQAVKAGAKGAVLSAPFRQSPQNTDTTNDMPTTQSNTFMDSEYDLMDESSIPNEAPLSTSPFAPENAQANVERILAAGGKAKDVNEYLSLVEALSGLTAGPEPKALNATQLQQANNANSALTDIQALAEEIDRDPNVLRKAAVPGGGLARSLTGTLGFDAAKKNVVDVIARLRSGAAITEDEARRYMSLLPGFTDNRDTAMQKLQRLNSLLQSFSNPQAAQPEYVMAQ